MGSATVIDTQPSLPMAEDKRTLKTLLAKPLRALNAWRGQKKRDSESHKKAEENEKDKRTDNINKEIKGIQVDKLVQNFHNLQIKKKNEEEENEEDELDKFSFKIVKVEKKHNDRLESRPSQDSGFSENSEEKGEKCIKDEQDDLEDEVLVPMRQLKIEERPEAKEKAEKPEEPKKEGRKKRLQTVAVSRGPVKNKNHGAVVHPYGYNAADSSFKQINQINKQTFSGGHVIFNDNRGDNFTELDVALKKVELSSLAHNTHREELLDLVQEYINEENSPTTNESSEDILQEFIRGYDVQDNFEQLNQFVQTHVDYEPNAIEQFHNTEHIPLEDEVNERLYNDIFPTPPRSENVPSPMSDTQSYYPSSTDYILSPELPSPQEGYETYQEIPYEDQIPVSVENVEKEEVAERKRERNPSTSSIKLKVYREMQTSMNAEFSKKECCQENRKPCKKIFQEHMQKLKIEHRKSLCVKVASFDLNTAYGVLHHILMALSRTSEHEDLHHALFCLICERVLSQQPKLFADDFGLSLLKSAALRCRSRPLLTRYLVQCVRVALRTDPTLAEGKEYLYREIDAQGDNLIIACARAGDSCAGALSELVRRDADQLPLFLVNHRNAEGYSALHVASKQHSADVPSLHVIHVLLKHAGADLRSGDVRGDDTALHFAVNSPTCELQLVLLMFCYVPRSEWKKLAHLPNRSSVTPLEYARCATKSTTRQNYPKEVLEFLKKCR